VFRRGLRISHGRGCKRWADGSYANACKVGQWRVFEIETVSCGGRVMTLDIVIATGTTAAHSVTFTQVGKDWSHTHGDPSLHWSVSSRLVAARACVDPSRFDPIKSVRLLNCSCFALLCTTLPSPVPPLILSFLLFRSAPQCSRHEPVDQSHRRRSLAGRSSSACVGTRSKIGAFRRPLR
jgi:hypothetical protein